MKKSIWSGVPAGFPKDILTTPDAFYRAVAFDVHGPILQDWEQSFGRLFTKLYGITIEPGRFYALAANQPDLSAKISDALNVYSRLDKGGFGDLTPVPHISEAMQMLQQANIWHEFWTQVPGFDSIHPRTNLPLQTGDARRVTVDLLSRLGLVKYPKMQIKFIHSTARADELVRRQWLVAVDNLSTTPVSYADAGRVCFLVPEAQNATLRNQNVVRIPSPYDPRWLAEELIGFFARLEPYGVLKDGLPTSGSSNDEA